MNSEARLSSSPKFTLITSLQLIFVISFPDYESSGAKVVDRKAAFQSDIVLKVRAPSTVEAGYFRDEGTLYSFLYPAQNKDLIDALAKHNLTVFGMDCVPRISRAQVFDALSSMGNIAGYR